MALAQEPDILLLDEPTSFLDIAHQIDVLDVLDRLNRTRGTTVVMVLHDINLAARYADHLIMMAAGRIIGAGPPARVISAASVRAAFGLAARVVDDPVSGTPMVIPLGGFRQDSPSGNGQEHSPSSRTSPKRTPEGRATGGHVAWRAPGGLTRRGPRRCTPRRFPLRWPSARAPSHR
jgi:ABC-type multidrug transport system ATPase subunit